MSGPKKNKKEEFSILLEAGAKVDDIFKDDTKIGGVDPFMPIEVIETRRSTGGAALFEEPKNSSQIEPLEIEGRTMRIESVVDDSAVVIQKKYQAIEKLLNLINEPVSFGEFISQILRVTLGVVRSEAGSVFEVDYANKNLFFRSVAGKSSQDLLKITVPMGAGIVGRVCATKKTEVLSQTANPQVHLKGISTLVGFETKDVIAAAIVIQGRVFGCIELLNPTSSDAYKDSDKEILESICEYAGKIIENRLVLAQQSQAAGNPTQLKKAA